MGRVQIITFVILKASHFNIFIQSNSLFVFDTTVNPSLGGCALCFQFLKLINPLVSSFTKSSLRESQEDFFCVSPPWLPNAFAWFYPDKYKSGFGEESSVVNSKREREICLPPRAHRNLIPDYFIFFLKCFGLWRNRIQEQPSCATSWRTREGLDMRG